MSDNGENRDLKGQTGIDIEEPDQTSQTSLVKYEPPAKDVAIATVAETVARVIDALESMYDKMELGVKHAVDTAAQVETPSEEIMGIRAKMKARVARILNSVINSMRKTRILEITDLAKLPLLIAGDVDEDLLTKADINDILDSRVGAFLPFLDEMRVIGAYAFGKGISSEKLIKYFETDQILDIMISELLSVEDSRFRGTSVYAMVRSLIKSASRRLKTLSARMKKQPVTEELEEEIIRNIAYFASHYDPHDREDTISKFTKDLIRRYSGYDVAGWLKENKKLLKEILGGKKAIEHIPNIIGEVYEECGRTDPGKFIQLSLPSFLSKQIDGENIDIHPTFRKILTKAEIDEPYAVLDIEQLEYFFAEIMPRIETERNNLTALRSAIVVACISEIESMGVRSVVLRSTDMKYSARKFGTTSELQTFVKETITSSCKIVSSKVDVGNLFVDPLDVPDEIRENYNICFNEEGKLRKGGYENFITRLFGHTTISVREKGKAEADESEKLTAKVEGISKIKRRIERLFKEADSYVDSIAEKSGIPVGDIILEEIKTVNDYAELIRIACKDPDPRKRFEARRKIELAVLIYNCVGNQRYVEQEHDAKAVKAVLESKKDRLRTFKELQKVRFIDYKDGRTQILGKGDRALVDADKGCIREEILIPVEFAGIRCYLMPANSEGTEYMSEKTLQSMITNLINDKEKRGARDLTDLIRTTFVVNDQKSFDSLCRHLERGYVGFGMTLKQENRYKKMVRVRAVGANKAKSAEYKATRYVMDIPVEGEGGASEHFAPMETRIFFTKDFVIDRSRYHPASHAKYEERRVEEALEKLAPEEIYPEAYKTILPHKDDISCRVHTVLKTKEDYALAA